MKKTNWFYSKEYPGYHMNKYGSVFDKYEAFVCGAISQMVQCEAMEKGFKIYK